MPLIYIEFYHNLCVLIKLEKEEQIDDGENTFGILEQTALIDRCFTQS